MKSIDFKSLLIGILGTLLVIACTGAKQLNIVQSKSAIGRYQLSCAALSVEAHCFVMDTTSAKILGRVYYGDIVKNHGLVDPSVLDN